MDFDNVNEIITPTKSTSLTISGTGALFIPAGTVGQRPASPQSGYIRFNTTDTVLEYYNGVAVQWQTFGSATLNSLLSVSGTGMLVQTSPGVYAARSIAGTTNRVTLTNGDGVAGNPTIDISSAYVGQATITTLGTVGTGVWQGTAVGATFGGTGQTVYAVGDILAANTTTTLSRVADIATGNALISGGVNTLPLWGKIGLTTHVTGVLPIANGGTALATTPTNGQLLIGNGTSYTLSTLTGTAGNVTVTNAAGSITLNLATAGTAGTYATVTTDTFGRVTSGSATQTIATGGTGLTALGTANQILGVNTGATGLEYKTVTAGAGITITPSAGAITIASTATGTVTSVGLALPSIFTVSGSPVITTGTLTGTLVAQANNLVFAGPISGGPLAPTFRALSLIGNDLSDVAISSPLANQVLAYNSGTSKWINTGAVGANATGTVGVSPTGGGTAWTLISGNSYRADFVHNLGTTNVVVTCWDTNTNAIVIPNNVVTLSATTVRITVTGNTRTIKVVVVANGQSIVAGGSTPSSVITAYEGVTISAAATKLNFQGQAVGVVDAGAGTTNITIGSRFTYFANSLDTPNNSDFALNVLAPVTTDPTYASLNVRSFSNTTEQGVACTVSIPTGATTMTVKIRGRAQTAPGVVSVVQPRLYARLLPNNSAVGAWSAAKELTNISIPTNANFQYYTYSATLSSLTLTAGSLYQFEFTRRTAGVTGTNLAANFLMAELTLEFA